MNRKVIALGLLLGASVSMGFSRQTLKVLNWNVETFFDVQTEGTEYINFINSKDWSEERYAERVKRLCSVIKKADADLLVFEEVENEGVLQDIVNFLGSNWKRSKNYKYSCFAKNPGASIGIGVVSRFPLGEMKLHEFQVDLDGEQQPPTRPILEVEVKCKGGALVLFANHWKSKSGGEKESEVWRNLQENVLAVNVGRSIGDSKNVLICGDFNRDIGEFNVVDRKSGTVSLRGPMAEWDDDVDVTSVWFDGTGSLVQPGSYCYRGAWSRIDHIFHNDTVTVKSFEVMTDGPWSDEETKAPVRYQISRGNGYSDHLPLLVKIEF